MTIRDVALHLNVSGDVIKEIQKRDLSRRFANDEIAVAKGHRYLTIVMDLDRGLILIKRQAARASAG